MRTSSAAEFADVKQASRRLRSERARSTREPQVLAHRVSHPLLRLQRSIGNRAVAAIVQRDKRKAGGSVKGGRKSPLTMSMFRAAYPGIMNALDYEHTKIWFDIISGWQANREVNERLREMDEKARANAWSDPSYGTYRLTEDYKAKAAAIEAHRKFVDEGSSRAPLDPAKILKADITAPQAWNVDAESRFRNWAVEYISSKPLEAELSTRQEIVSQWERTEHPELDAGFHANLLWGGRRLWNTQGYIGWNDLMHISEVREKYEADVSNGPHIQAIRAAIDELSSHIREMMREHQNRSDKNAEHGVVRHVSEALGGPSMMELQILRMRVQANPNDIDAKAALAEKEAEAGDYPKMKGPDGIWFQPQQQLAAADRFFKAGQVELAAAAIAECQKSTAIATARFAGYERRVMRGAGVAVTWLERAKTAGKIASAFTGAGGIVRASITAGGYTFAQEGSQQVVAHWIDSSNKIDLGGLAEQAAIDGLATLFGGLTQGAFVNALSARFGARMVASGLSEATTKTVLSAVGATTASFYNVPAKAVLDKIIAGKAMPHSLSEVCDMIVVEAVQSGAMDVVGGYVQKSGTRHEAPPETAPGTTTGPEVKPLPEVVKALAGPEGAAYAEAVAHPPMIGKPGHAPAKPISAEARRIAARLDPVRAEWGTLSPASRAQRLVDAVHAELAATGLPKPTAILNRGEGGDFDFNLWIVKLDPEVLTKRDVTVDEFAVACEEARHEMEHALQFFRIARREARLHGRDTTALAARLQMPRYIVEMAIKANDRTIPAERLEGTQADIDANAHFESVYGAGNPHRQETLEKLPKVIEALADAERRVDEATPDQRDDAIDLQYRAMLEYNKVIDDYVNLPEEIPAWEAGRQVSQAVKERLRLNEQMMRVKDKIKRAQAEVERVRTRIAATGDDRNERPAVRREMRRAFTELLKQLNKARQLQSSIAAVSGGAST